MQGTSANRCAPTLQAGQCRPGVYCRFERHEQKLLNMTVILVNGGHMPVNAVSMRAVQGEMEIHKLEDPHIYGNTRLAGPSSHLVTLSDIVPVPMPNGQGNVYSLGDVLIASGISVMVHRATCRRESR